MPTYKSERGDTPPLFIIPSKMFSRLATMITVVSLVVLAAASPTGSQPPSTCSTGPVQCCNSVEKASYWYEHGGAGLWGLLGTVVKDVEELLGFNCSPLSFNEGGGSGCQASTVCCEDNSYGGWIAIGCVPISL